MHELSIVMSIIKLAAEQADADMIEEIELDIGCLSGIDMDSFDFAWKQAIKQTVLRSLGVRQSNSRTIKQWHEVRE